MTSKYTRKFLRVLHNIWVSNKECDFMDRNWFKKKRLKLLWKMLNFHYFKIENWIRFQLDIVWKQWFFGGGFSPFYEKHWEKIIYILWEFFKKKSNFFCHKWIVYNMKRYLRFSYFHYFEYHKIWLNILKVFLLSLFWISANLAKYFYGRKRRSFVL